jgi:hypothetical protein
MRGNAGKINKEKHNMEMRSELKGGSVTCEGRAEPSIKSKSLRLTCVVK